VFEEAEDEAEAVLAVDTNKITVLAVVINKVVSTKVDLVVNNKAATEVEPHRVVLAETTANHHSNNNSSLVVNHNSEVSKVDSAANTKFLTHY
jgi:hypothetical protein